MGDNYKASATTPDVQCIAVTLTDILSRTHAVYHFKQNRDHFGLWAEGNKLPL